MPNINCVRTDYAVICILFLTADWYLKCEGATTAGVTGPTTTDPPTTTGTTQSTTLGQFDTTDAVSISDPVVYGPLAAGAVVLVTTVVVAAVLIAKKGLVGMASSTPVTQISSTHPPTKPADTWMKPDNTPAKKKFVSTKSQVKPVRIKIGPNNRASISVVRLL